MSGAASLGQSAVPATVRYFQNGGKTYGYDPTQTALIAAAVAAKWPEVTGSWPPPAPAPTLAQQAQTALGAGLTVTSTATPAISGTYACDAATQSKLASLYNLIQRAGGAAFPAGMTALPWPDMRGAVHSFTAVSDFLNLETAIGNYVLALDLIVTTNSGTLPAASVTIP